MKAVYLSLIILFSLNAMTASGQDHHLKVMTFNIRYDNPDDGVNRWKNRRSLVISTLLEKAPDIIGMQEVLEHQATYLDKNLPGYGYVGAGRDDGKEAGEFSPVFFRKEALSLMDWGTFWLSETPLDTGSVGWDAALPRICTWVKFRETTSGHDFFFLNTHFDHMGKTARAESARLILDFVRDHTCHLPVVLTGDFNCAPGEEPYQVMVNPAGGLQEACRMVNISASCTDGTFNNFGRETDPQRIDMIFTKGGWHAERYEVIRATEGKRFVSDHWPVAADLVFPKDTLMVQTFTFDSIATRRAVFRFPEEGGRYEKILMYYTLKCDSLTPHDQYPCGEWDYTTYTRVFHGDSLNGTEQFEIGRFITPYGKRLDLGLNGFTWVYDVTDYAPLLHGMVDLQAANGQELLDLRFLFIRGIPPRDVISIRNIWPEGSYIYKELSDDMALNPVSFELSDKASAFMLRARISGHGHFGPKNCCEWDPKLHSFLVNGEKKLEWKVWRDCGMNPVHPQGGTWQFDRAGWCPGTFVDTYDFEITPYVSPGGTIAVDYQIEPYNPENGEEGGNYEMAMHLFEFSAPNCRLDLELTDILSPSIRHEFRRMNPVSLNPVIRVRNNGSDTIRSFSVVYGLAGNTASRFDWSGKLGYMESADIILPKPSWEGMNETSRFEAVIETANGTGDERSSNNSMQTAVEAPVILPPAFFIHVKTQGFGRAADNAYTIINETGEVVHSREIFEDDSTYHDLVHLAPGAYDFTFTDQNEDGMIRHWWLRNSEPDKIGENGELKILDAEQQDILNLGYDFAEKRTLQFFVGEPK